MKAAQKKTTKAPKTNPLKARLSSALDRARNVAKAEKLKVEGAILEGQGSKDGGHWASWCETVEGYGPVVVDVTYKGHAYAAILQTFSKWTSKKAMMVRDLESATFTMHKVLLVPATEYAEQLEDVTVEEVSEEGEVFPRFRMGAKVANAEEILPPYMDSQRPLIITINGDSFTYRQTNKANRRATDVTASDLRVLLMEALAEGGDVAISHMPLK